MRVLLSQLPLRSALPLVTTFILAGVLSKDARSQVVIKAVVNSASFQSLAGKNDLSLGVPLFPSGGALATAFCSGITKNPGVYVASSTPLPFLLGGVSVYVNGGIAPLLAVVIPSQDQSSALTQINFQVPMERNSVQRVGSLTENSLENVEIDITSDSGPASLTINNTLRGLGGFFTDGNGYVIAQHASDYSPVTLQNPAHAGQTIIAYADDFFEVWPPPPMGFPVPLQPLFKLDPNLAVSDLYYHGQHLYLQSYPPPNFKGGTAASTPAIQILFEGLAPGMIGVEQINFVVPPNQQPGDWALFFNVNPDGGLQGVSSAAVVLPVR